MNQAKNEPFVDQEWEEGDRAIFSAYTDPLSGRTRRRQERELASLRAFALQQGCLAQDLLTAPGWSQIEGALVAAYIAHLQAQHYKASSIGIQLHTIKKYASLAAEAGYLPLEAYKAIKKLRPPQETEPRPSRFALTDQDVQRLLQQPDTTQGRRDALCLALLLQCGLWPRSIVALNRSSFNLVERTVSFYSYATHEYETCQLDPLTLAAATQYLKRTFPYEEALFVGNRKAGTGRRLTDRTVNHRVQELGKKIGLKGLIPKDCHAYWKQTHAE